MKFGLKRIWHDREIREAIWILLGVSFIAACVSCFLLTLWRNAVATSPAAVLSSLWSALITFQCWKEVLAIFFSTLLAMVLWFIYIECKIKKLPSRYLSCFTERFNWKSTQGGLLISFVVIAFSVLLLLAIDYTTGEGRGLVIYVVDNPGGVFAILTGSITVIGTYVAIQSILELKHTITSYPQLIDRLLHMIAEIEDSNAIMFLAFSPLTGAWNIDTKQRNKMLAALTSHKHKIKMICLNPEDHLALLIEIAKSGTLEKGQIDASEVVEFQRECGGVVWELGAKGDKQPGKPEPTQEAKDCCIKAKHLPRAKMPGYYFGSSAEFVWNWTWFVSRRNEPGRGGGIKIQSGITRFARPPALIPFGS